MGSVTAAARPQARRKVTKIYPRPCFSCGDPMVLADDSSTILECRACEIWEDGAIQGRFHLLPGPGTVWCGEMVPYIDHGNCYMPTP